MKTIRNSPFTYTAAGHAIFRIRSVITVYFQLDPYAIGTYARTKFDKSKLTDIREKNFMKNIQGGNEESDYEVKKLKTLFNESPIK